MRYAVIMHIYFSGLGGVAIGPLALICRDAGYEVSGSDMQESRWTKLIEARGIPVAIGQDGEHIAKVNQEKPIDWLVVSSAIPSDHPEVQFAKTHDIKVTKRADLLNKVLADKHLKLVAISGTHGKTTTTAMVVWLFKQFAKPVSYSIGSNISFGPAGAYEKTSEYFVYECDEYDRNLLEFRPDLSLITPVDYDHPDIYPTQKDYDDAFRQFISQSSQTIMWDDDQQRLQANGAATLAKGDPAIAQIKLPGLHNRQNAWEAVTAFRTLFPEVSLQEALTKISNFPGTDRRFEKLANNIYTTYTHHPSEVRADLQLARELNHQVIAVYQPHQNIRQHEIGNEYKDCFNLAMHVYWLPTYLSREDPNLPILTPTELIAKLDNPAIAEPAEMNDELAATIKKLASEGKLVVCMGAGSIDEWIRGHLA